MQVQQILLTLLLGEKNGESKKTPSIQALQELAIEFSQKIAEWDEESPLDDLEAYFPQEFRLKAQQVADEMAKLDETQENELRNGLIDDQLQWELLQYDDSVLSIMLGQSLPENVADEHFNVLVRRYPEWALALAEEMGEEEGCSCCNHEGQDHEECHGHHHGEEGCCGHCHHDHE